MRKLSRAAPVLVLILAMACATSATKAVYVTVDSAKAGVDLAMTTWAQYVVNQGRCTSTGTPPGCVPVDKENQVRAAYADVQASAHAAGVILTTTSQVVTPQSLQNAVNALVSLVQKLTGKNLGGTP